MGHIRTFLAIIVIISHTEAFFGFNFLGGKIAVQAFYIISGFYMSLILNEKYILQNNSYKLFITNRLIRLYPVYWATLLLIIISSLVLYFTSGGNNYGYLNSFIDNYHILNPLSIFILVFSNIFIIFQDVLLFFEVNLESGLFFFQHQFNKDHLNGFDFALIPQAWTVALEILFYTIAPFIVRRKTSVLIIIFSILIAINYVLKYQLGLNYTPWSFRFFPSELPLFLLGVFSYKLYRSKFKTLFKPKYNIYALIVITLFIILFDKFSFRLKHEMFFTLFFIAIPFIFQLTKASKIDRYIGELSYPLYITHMFVLRIVSKFNYIIINKGITVIILSVILSLVLKHFVSDKVEVYRQNRLKKIAK